MLVPALFLLIVVVPLMALICTIGRRLAVKRGDLRRARIAAIAAMLLESLLAAGFLILFGAMLMGPNCYPCAEVSLALWCAFLAWRNFRFWKPWKPRKPKKE